MDNITTYLLYAFEIGGLALNTAIVYSIFVAFIKVCRQKDWRKIALVAVAGGLAIFCVSGVMSGERSQRATTEAVNFILSHGLTWAIVTIALLCVLMHIFLALLHKRKPFAGQHAPAPDDTHPTIHSTCDC